MGAHWVSARFAIMAPFTFVLAFEPELRRRSGTVCIAVLTAVALARTASVAAIWHERQADLAALFRAYEAIPAGARVLPLEHRPSQWSAVPLGRYLDTGDATFRNEPPLGLIWRHVFVPTLFAARGKQPVHLRPPWDQLAEPDGGQLADVHVLDRPPALMPGIEFARYAAEWRRFDYALVLNADVPDAMGPLGPVPGVRLVADEGFARVYRITAPP